VPLSRSPSPQIKMRSAILSSIILAGAAQAWLPHEHELAAFNMTARYEQLGKRFQPTLPAGITKIRGVNFGSRLPESYSIPFRQEVKTR
jgi:hypothetical protein